MTVYLSDAHVVRILVAGTRIEVPPFHFDRLIRQMIKIFVPEDGKVIFVSGEAWIGADKQIIDWAKAHSYECECYPADWKASPRGAGYIRNAQMGKVSDVLIAFWDGKSRGTENMISIMKKAKKPVVIIRLKGTEDERQS